jgi:phenylalanyl-tRNA synthetase beta chain
MKLNESWLRERVNPNISTDELLSQLTMAGLEVEGTEPASPDFSNVVVGHVESVTQHPDADKLKLCSVNDGTETLNVVCGANNVTADMKVAFARVGAKLPEIKIKKAKIRGIESFGMLCSELELGLAENSDGIMELANDAPVGIAIKEYLKLEDTIIEIDLTPNRGDCLGIEGVAREIAAINRLPMSEYPGVMIAPQNDEEFPVELQAPEHCSRYVGRIVRNIDPDAKTPQWMREKLRRCGLRPISPVVDITNFVMIETGQPMHGFDFDKLEGGIVVRLAEAGEKLQLLDKSEVECRADTLLIADQKKAIALAGIMGGLNSSVQTGTQNIYFEAAFFSPITIAGKARGFGMHTDASHRFERGVDSNLQLIAVERATELLIQIAGGKPGPISNSFEEAHLPVSPNVILRFERTKRLLGIDVNTDEVESILASLNMTFESTDLGWLVTPPSYRFDINIEADLIEEVGRLVGYNNIQGTRELAHSRMQAFSETQLQTNQIKDILVEQGYFEAVTYSFVSPEYQKIFDPDQETLVLANPISADMSTMRTRLIPGLMQALIHNSKRQQSRIRLFESGLCFVPKGGQLDQTSRLAAVICGPRESENVYSNNDLVDFFDIKGDLEKILSHSGLADYSFVRSDNSILHPGQAADIMRNGKYVGFVGALHPSVLSKLGLHHPVFTFEVELEMVLPASLPKFTALSKFPSIRRDIAVMVDVDIQIQDLIDCIYSLKSKILQEVFAFDVYTGNVMRNFRKSVALGLILQDFSRTLVDEDVEKLVEKVLQRLKEQHNAILREN